jgi:hypothetical protein
MREGETLVALLEHHDGVARTTDEIVATLPDLSVRRAAAAGDARRCGDTVLAVKHWPAAGRE